MRRRAGPAVDLLGFLESLGFAFELRGEEIDLRVPPLPVCMASRVRDVLPALRIELEARAARRQASPAVARRISKRRAPGDVAVLHRRRGEWDAFVYAGTVHPVFAGVATTERQARLAAREKFAAIEARGKQ